MKIEIYNYNGKPDIEAAVIRLVAAHNAKEPKEEPKNRGQDINAQDQRNAPQQQPRQDITWPDAKTKEAALWPRVGDRWTQENYAPHCLSVTKVSNDEIEIQYSDTGQKVSWGRNSFTHMLETKPISRLVSRGPEPKALRDGDCFWDHFNNGPHLLYTEFPPSSWRCSLADHFKLNPDNPIIFNILDLAAAVQRGEKVVTLTMGELEIGEYYTDSEITTESRSLHVKLRAAIGGGQ
jgi:hypothetical protein